MATKAPKTEEAAAGAEAPAAASGSKKKKIIIIAVIAVLLLGGGGGAAFFLTKKPADAKEAAKKPAEKAAPPVFLQLDNFIVNLASDNGDKYLQAGITLQVRGEEQANYYKTNMPQLRSRLLLLLSSKSSEELLTNEGKLKLSDEIIEQAEIPYNKDEPTPKEAEERRILGVFYTSFMIQ